MNAKQLRIEGLEQRALLAVSPLISETTVAKAFVPTTQNAFDDLGLDWVSPIGGFDDSAWSSTPAGGPNGVGFPDGPGAKYDGFVGLNLQPTMQNVSSTAFVRIPFAAASVANIEALTLKLRLDDGFIAWLNGVEIARANAPAGYPMWTARATAGTEATTAFTTFDVSSHKDLLVSGMNLLAIRGFNLIASQNDFVIQAALDAEIPDAPPTAINDTASVQQGASTVINVLANDSPGSAAIDPRTVQVVGQPDHGTATVNSTTGAITYTPDANFRGTDTLIYRVRDSSPVPTPGDSTQVVTVVSTNALHHRLVPTAADAAIGTTWTGGGEPFSTANWTAAAGGIGYDHDPSFVDFTPYIGDNVGGLMSGINATAYVRVPFTIDEPTSVQQLRLRMRYDDGFIAYINGVQIAAANAPAAPTWNSQATATHINDEAIIQQEFIIPLTGLTLRSGIGQNILAIHALNFPATSSDLLMQPELIVESNTTGRWSNEALVTVHVTGVGPTAVDDVASTIGTAPVTIPVLANDEVAAPPNDYPLQPESVTIVNPPDHGAVLVDPLTGAVTYTANAGFTGEDTFEYTVRDSAPVGGESQSHVLIPEGAVWKYLDNGTDQGTAWSERTFNDSAWQSGPGPLGYATGAPNGTGTTVSYGPDANNKYITTYFRRGFTIDDAAKVESLNLTLRYDDGAVIYINGVEVERINLPGGTINYQTLAPAAFNGTFTALLTGDKLASLRSGENVIAVEIHQTAATSSDIVMDLGLAANVTAPTGRVSNPATVSITVASTNEPPIANPDSAFTLAGETVQIDVLANDVPSGAPLDIGSVVIVAAPTRGTATVASNGRIHYTPTAGLLGVDSFTYTVRDTDGRLSNPATVSVLVASSIVSLGDDEYFVDEDDVLIVPVQYGVLANDTSSGGAVVSASVVEAPLFGTLTLAADGSFQYTPNANFSGADEFTYRGADGSGSSAVARVTIRVTPSPDAPIAFGDVYSTTVNTPLVVVAAPEERQVLIPAGATWRYLDDGSNLGSAWRSLEFDDSEWASGPAQLGYGDGDEATVVGFGDDFNHRHITTYFRREFFVPDRSQVHELQLGLLRDDGAVVYLNGTQIVSSNMPTGSIAATTLALASVTGSEENAFLMFDLNPVSLVPGRNVLAVRVHQANGTSNDMSFDLFLRGDVAGPVTGGVLANDSDPDGDYLTATIVTPPSHGTLSMTADGGFTYTPNAGFEGSDTFTYRANDGMRDSNVATVVLNVTPLGLLPGDLNDDGFVDPADLAIVVRGLGMTDGADRLKGDANGDGCVDLHDVLEVQRAMGAQRPAGAAAGAIVASARNADGSAASDAVLTARASRTALAATRRERAAVVRTTGATLLGTANVDRTIVNWESGGEQASTRTLRAGRRR